MQNRKLYRARSDRWFLGVISGLGRYFGLSADVVTLIRIAVLVIGIFSFFSIFIIYLIAAWVIPVEGGGTKEQQGRKVKEAEIFEETTISKRDKHWDDF